MTSFSFNQDHSEKEAINKHTSNFRQNTDLGHVKRIELV